MILYGLELSPFVARVRLALRVKGIEHDFTPPPGGSSRSEQFLAINPIGKVPVLVCDNGAVLAESETIIDYLDETFPEPPLMPAAPEVRARVRNIIRTHELYATPALFRLFKQIDPATRDTAVVQAEVAQWRNGLSLTNHFVDDATFAAGGAFSKADCILLPSLLLCGIIASLFELGDIVADYPNLAGYREKARMHADIGAIWDSTVAALQTMNNAASKE